MGKSSVSCAACPSADACRLGCSSAPAHLQRTFKLSRDPRFVDKLFDVVGFYLEPPDKALVLSCDEKSQIQALNRTQPGLPMKRGRAGTMTHDYKRNGTTTLFAALNTLDGTVISMCQDRHRHEEWLKFLAPISPQLVLCYRDSSTFTFADRHVTTSLGLPSSTSCRSTVPQIPRGIASANRTATTPSPIG